MIHSFLMVGQSNMAGRGYLRDVGQIFDEQIKTLVNGRWQTMTEPINFDRPTAGIGLAASFAGAWRLDNADDQIGLIPCADGGSSLDDWAVGGALFENAVFCARQAKRVSKLKGILWHQGENDSFSGHSAAYYDKLCALVQAFRNELEAPQIPIIVGGLGDFLNTGRYGKYFTEHQQVNQMLHQYAEAKPDAFFVSAEGLTANQDSLHFNAVSQRIFGIRYYEAYSKRKNILKPLPKEVSRVKKIEAKPLTKTEKIALLEISFADGRISLNELEEHLAMLNH